MCKKEMTVMYKDINIISIIFCTLVCAVNSAIITEKNGFERFVISLAICFAFEYVSRKIIENRRNRKNKNTNEL